MFRAVAGLLAFFYGLWPSFGMAIVMLTVTVRLALLPLTAKQAQTARAMQQAQPQVKAVQAQYRDDRQKLNEELVRFYKERNLNPLGGCLPLLAQVPVFIALSRVVRGLTGCPLLVAAVVAGGMWQQRQLQARRGGAPLPGQQLTRMMPALFGFMCLSMPAGVVLYFATTTVWTVAQQAIVFRTHDASAAA